MIRIVQISAVAQHVFCLLEDGTLSTYDVAKDEWNLVHMPFDYDTRAIGVVADTRVPAEVELIHNAQTQMWSWRMKDDPEVTGDVFDGKEEAIRDAKQRRVIKSTEHLPI
jgi:hypothetical protein